jgi:ssDNA-specific exonuclease RecJ
MKKRVTGIFRLIKHIYKTAINDFHAIFQSNCRHYLTALPNSDCFKVLTVYETIYEGGPRKCSV